MIFNIIGTNHEEISSNFEGQTVQDLRQKLADLEEKKKIVMLTRKLNAIQEEKAAGFSELPMITIEENVNDVLIRRKIIEEFKLPVPSIKLYMGR